MSGGGGGEFSARGLRALPSTPPHPFPPPTLLRRSRAARREAEDAQRVAVLAGKLVEAEERLRAAGEAEAGWRAREGEWRAREAELNAARERGETACVKRLGGRRRTERSMCLTPPALTPLPTPLYKRARRLLGLTQELRAWKESMGASAGDVSSRLAEATRELALARLREAEGAGTAAALGEARGEVARLRAALLDSEALRRKLHNTVQELKGSVRVMVRVRPPSGEEAAAAAAAGGGGEGGGVVLGADGASLEVALPAAAEGGKAGAPGAASGKPGKPVRAAFDRVFGPADGQAAVFEEVSTLVQSGAHSRAPCARRLPQRV